MGRRRRRAITEQDARVILAVAAASGGVAALAGCSPTGEGAIDVVLAALVGVVVPWASARAIWWSLLGASALAVVFSGLSLPSLAAAIAAFGCAAWVATHRASASPLRALAGACLVQSALRFGWQPSFGVDALAAVVCMGVPSISGVMRRPRGVRRRVVLVVASCGGFVIVGLVGLAVAGLRAQQPATDGYRALLLGLEKVGSGEPAEAASALRSAASDLRSADAALASVWAQPSRLLPVVAPNRLAASTLLVDASLAASAAADALELVDLDQLQIVNGVVDVGAVAVLSEPLKRLEATITELQQRIDEVDSPWLLPAITERLEGARRRADKVATQARGTASIARVAPALLGAEGDRRYLMAFVSPGESRGTSGVMGNWAELAVSDGRISLVETGRTSELSQRFAAAGPFFLSGMEPGFLDRYGDVGAGAEGSPVDHRYWSNVTMSPHMPLVGAQMAQMYEHATGRRIDGVFVLDPAAIAALLQVTGPVDLPESGVTLDAATAERFLLVDQYANGGLEREDLLAEATQATIDRLLSSNLPGPQVIAARLGPVAVSGHLSAYATRSAEQAAIELVGIDAGLPALAGRDGIGLTLDNAAGNKIDSFLNVDVQYRAVVDEGSGSTEATATVTIRNTAPSSGYPDYVIGNLLDLPRGTARFHLGLLTALDFESAELDGSRVGLSRSEERGWNVLARTIDIPAGATTVLSVRLRGTVTAGPSSLVVRPPALARPVQWDIAVENSGGGLRFDQVGRIERRSVLGESGLAAYRS